MKNNYSLFIVANFFFVLTKLIFSKKFKFLKKFQTILENSKKFKKFKTKFKKFQFLNAFNNFYIVW